MAEKPTYEELEKRIQETEQALHDSEQKNRALQETTIEALFFSSSSGIKVS